MLEMRPSCENCDADLPADSTEACICSYECTFCDQCVEEVLLSVCPNCGGGFTKRPVRPSTEWRAGVSLAYQPAATERTLKRVDIAAHQKFVDDIKSISEAK